MFKAFIPTTFVQKTYALKISFTFEPKFVELIFLPNYFE